jgi:DNA polymerase III delta prime subunit
MATKKQPSEFQMEQQALHLKYRPRTLDKVIGHENVVTRIRGMLKSGKTPSAIALFGPPSAGKTTLARCIATEINGSLNSDYKEVNAADERGIDDVRELIKTSKFRPQTKKRIIFVDEAHQLVANNAAAQTWLKSLEEPSPSTLWIVGSMEQGKFGSTVGKAILSRCTQFILEQHTNNDLLKQALRIARGEDMDWAITEDRMILKELVRNSNGEMRTLANLIQGMQQYYDGLEKKPKVLSKDHLAEVVSTSESSDDRLAVQFMIGLYSLKFTQVQRALLDVTDAFSFVKKLTFISRFHLNLQVVDNGRHPKIWWNSQNRSFLDGLKKIKVEPQLGQIAATHAMLVEVQGRSATFTIEATDLLSAAAYNLIKSWAK